MSRTSMRVFVHESRILSYAVTCSTRRWTPKHRTRLIGVVLALLGIALWLAAGPLFPYVLSFAEQYLSSDHHITQRGCQHFRQTLVLCGSLPIVASILCTLAAHPLATLGTRLLRWWHSASGVGYSRSLLYISSISGIVLAGLFLMKDPLGIRNLYSEDQLFETLSAILFLAAAALFALTIRLLVRASMSKRRIIIVACGLLAISAFFFGMEEISWGQRLFGVRTPEVLEAINDQGELNLHNLSNSLLEPLYRWGSGLLALGTVSGWLLQGWKGDRIPGGFLIPHPSLLPLVLLILLFGAIMTLGELLEELGSVFVFLYAASIRQVIRRGTASHS